MQGVKGHIKERETRKETYDTLIYRAAKSLMLIKHFPAQTKCSCIIVTDLLFQMNFLFAQIRDRKMLLNKVSDFLSKQPTPKRYNLYL